MASTTSLVAACICATWAPISSVALAGLRGEALDLGRHHGKAFACITGARGFDRGVQCQQIGLARDVGDQTDHGADLFRPLGQRSHDLIGPFRVVHRFAGDLRRLPDLAADFANGGRQFLGGSGHRLQSGGSLLGGGGHGCRLLLTLVRGTWSSTARWPPIPSTQMKACRPASRPWPRNCRPSDSGQPDGRPPPGL